MGPTSPGLESFLHPHTATRGGIVSLTQDEAFPSDSQLRPLFQSKGGASATVCLFLFPTDPDLPDYLLKPSPALVVQSIFKTWLLKMQAPSTAAKGRTDHLRLVVMTVWQRLFPAGRERQRDSLGHRLSGHVGGKAVPDAACSFFSAGFRWSL